METCWEVGALLLVMTCDYECSARLTELERLGQSRRHDYGFTFALTNPVLVTAMANRLKSRTAR